MKYILRIVLAGLVLAGLGGCAVVPVPYVPAFCYHQDCHPATPTPAAGFEATCPGMFYPCYSVPCYTPCYAVPWNAYSGHYVSRCYPFCAVVPWNAGGS